MEEDDKKAERFAAQKQEVGKKGIDMERNLQ